MTRSWCKGSEDPPEPPAGDLISLPAVWDGQDLRYVERLSGLDVVTALRQQVFTVAFCGFAPGFAYMKGLPGPLHLPRRSRPRPRVPAGSIAIAAGYLAVYPTDLPRWLAPAGPLRCPPVRPRGDRAGAADTGHAGAVLMIVRALGAQTLVQDAGRHGYAHLGVPTAGAFDQFSWRLGNRLVGNPDECASLECLGGGLAPGSDARTSRWPSPALQAPWLWLDRSRSTDEPLHVAPGDRLTLGTPRSGLRYYVAIAGGWTVEPTLWLAVEDTLGQLGPTVRIGDHLSIGPRRGGVTVDHAPPRPGRLRFDVTPGPDLDLAPLLEREWDLDPQSNRIGVRLTGDPISARHHQPAQQTHGSRRGPTTSQRPPDHPRARTIRRRAATP